MKRREFIGLASGVAAWPLAGRAQQGPRMRRVGILYGGTETHPETVKRLSIFRGGLEKAGWVPGVNLEFLAYYSTPADPVNMARQARQLLESDPEVIVCNGTPLASLLKAQTSRIPVVFVSATDPVSSGLVRSLNHPDGNLTGFTNLEFSIAGKWLQILREIAPRTRVVMVLTVPNNPGNIGLTEAVEAAGPALGVRVERAMISSPEVLARELTRFVDTTDGAVVTTSASIFTENTAMILQIAGSRNMPAFFPSRSFVDDGGLVSYGPDIVDLYRRAADYVDRLLRGAKVAELPVQVPTKFELVLNLKTAKALGLNVPAHLLATADDVIE